LERTFSKKRGGGERGWFPIWQKERWWTKARTEDLSPNRGGGRGVDGIKTLSKERKNAKTTDKREGSLVGPFLHRFSVKPRTCAFSMEKEARLERVFK